MSTTALGIAGVAAAAPGQVSAGFFQQALPARVILASFFVLTLPLAALISVNSTSLLVPLYLCLFGTTHFVVTFAVYLRRDNLEHFMTGWRNRMVFFGVPLLIFASFYFIGALRLVAAFPLFGMWFRAVIRLADFNHFSRQTFGVHQLFKARAGLRAPAGLKRLENFYYGSLSGLLFCTFLAGGRSPLLEGGQSEALVSLALLKPLTWGVLAVCGALLTAVVAGTLRASREAGEPAGLGELFGYLAFQTISGLASVISLPLYAATLAMHYVEYHTLMFPRCFHSRLDGSSALDRWFGRLRASRGAFYAALIAISVLVFGLMTTSINLMGMNARPGTERYLVFVAIFDGLFVFHYFVEMYIWRFNDPFFRKDLALYFAPRR